jgi:hypothetical protein
MFHNVFLLIYFNTIILSYFYKLLGKMKKKKHIT